MTIGDRIKKRREELGLSQEELANRLGLRGRSSVSKAEKSGDRMTNTLLQAYANALDCSPAYFVGDNQQHDSFTQIIVADDRLYEALHIYYSLSEEKRGYVISFIKMLAE